MNPLLMAFVNTDPLAQWAKASSIVVTGAGNRYDQAFQDARRAGALVYAYWMTFECPDDLNDEHEREMYCVDGEHPPLWPGRDANGQPRVNWQGTHLLDIRPTSPYFAQIERYARHMIGCGLFDGAQLDGHGYRLWSKTKTDEDGETIPGADWDTWPKAERDEWTAAMLAVAKRVHDIRMELCPAFEIVHNNVWDNYKAPGSEIGLTYANGPMGENWKYDPWHIGYVCKDAAPGLKKRVLIISPTQAIADSWKVDPNVTHITLVDKAAGENYKTPTAPIVDYEDERPPCWECEQTVAELEAENATLRVDNDCLRTANAKLEAKNAAQAATLAQIHQLSEPT